MYQLFADETTILPMLRTHGFPHNAAGGWGSETRRSEVGPWRSHVAQFCPSRQYRYLSTAQIITCTPVPSHSSPHGQSLLFAVKILSRSTPTCGGGCDSFVFGGSRTHCQRPCILRMTVNAQLSYKTSQITKHN